MPATASTSAFGVPATASTSAFGVPATASTSAFGVPAAASTSAFGVPATASTSAFGVPATASTSAFGVPATASTSAFGVPATASTSAFGVPATASTSAFGVPAAASTSAFGVPTSTIGFSNTTPVTSSNCAAPSLFSMRFHPYHSPDVSVSADGSIARYFKSSWGCPFVFSARPVQFEEKVCLRILELSSSWMGLSIGFTTENPANRSHIRVHEHKIRFLDLNVNDVLYYYLNSTGYVKFSVNGQSEDILFYFGRKSPFWAVLYVQCEAVQFVEDPRAPNQVRRPNQSETEWLTSDMRSLSVEEPLPQPRYQTLVPLSLHRTKGNNIQFTDDGGVAARIEWKYCQGYVFSALPVSPGQIIVVQILATTMWYGGSIAIGLTSCDPATLQPCYLPDDSDQLLDRQEYWVVYKDAASGARAGDELVVTFTLEGEVRISRGGSNITTMHVDHTVRLWAFVDLYGQTEKVRMLSSRTAQAPPEQRRDQRSPQIGTALAGSLSPQNGAQTLASERRIEGIQSSLLSPSRNDTHSSASGNTSNQLVHVAGIGQPSTNHASTQTELTPIHSLRSTVQRSDCRICYENPIDSTLYPCGHMCMCHGCAVDQWRGGGNGLCPLCRHEIKHVIYAYMS